MMEVYAPRAALYEALPDFLHRLTGTARNFFAPFDVPDSQGVPVWARGSAGRGSYEATRASVGAGYDFERFAVEAGLNISFGQRAFGWVSMRQVRGVADVAAPTGGGQIEATALGPTFGFSWMGGHGFYVTGAGSVTDYDLEFSSEMRGLLRGGVDGDGYSVSTEMGWRFELGEHASLTPRAWGVRPSVAVEEFTDAVESRVSFPESVRVIGGLGVVAEAASGWGGGRFALRGSADFGRTFQGRETVAWVSGEKLSSQAPQDGILAGLDVVYHKGPFSIGAELRAGTALQSNTREYSAFLRLGIHF